MFVKITIVIGSLIAFALLLIGIVLLPFIVLPIMPFWFLWQVGKSHRGNSDDQFIQMRCKSALDEG